MHIKSRMTQDYMSQMLYTGAKDFDTFLNGSHKAFSGKKKIELVLLIWRFVLDPRDHPYM